jgi:hypothetical protein
MTKHQPNDLARCAMLLTAAVQLKQTHGLLFAMRFLEDYHFNNMVIWELLNLIPAERPADDFG